MSTHSEIPDDVAALITAHALGALDSEQSELAERHIASSDACRPITVTSAKSAASSYAPGVPYPQLRVCPAT